MGERLKAIWAKIKEQISSIWDKDKGFVILIAIVAVIVKFRDILIDILVNSGKRVMDNAQKTDDKLLAKENDAKQQADDLVKQAQEEPKKQEPVTDDWYKKKE